MLKTNRQRELIEKLFNDLKRQSISPEINHKHIEVTLEIDNYSKSSNCSGYYSYDFKLTKCIITLSLSNLEENVRFGYPKGYYDKRDKKLSFVIGNRHKALRFVLLHELRHAYQRITTSRDIHNNKSTYTKELDADNFAIDKLQEVIR